ncbi:MAG: hypothetical protein R3E68_03500 [Burkholderiaceae bacterium]
MRIDSVTGFGTGEGSGQLAGGHVAQPGRQMRPPETPELDRPPRAGRQKSGLAVLLTITILALNLAVWAISHPSVSAPDFQGSIAGMAYNGFQRWDSPLEGRFPSEESLQKDMQVMATRTDRLRTYSSSEMPRLPALANAVGLKLTAGVWIDTRPENNQREIDAAVLAVENHRNIERLIVGNESLLHGLVTTDELIGYLDQVRRRAHVPVSTAEPWHVWLRNPRLADHVDYIAVHLLPYWEGVPHAVAVDYAFQRLEEVRQRFPGKQVVIGEIGWPSQGDRFDGAGANRVSQAVFIRQFLARTAGMNLDYFMMEAVDQPWKRATEGRVGSYWGMMDASRDMKFPLAGPIPSDPNWLLKASLASLLAAGPIFLFLRRFPGMRLPSRLFFAALIQGARRW